MLIDSCRLISDDITELYDALNVDSRNQVSGMLSEYDMLRFGARILTPTTPPLGRRQVPTSDPTEMEIVSDHGHDAQSNSPSPEVINQADESASTSSSDEESSSGEVCRDLSYRVRGSSDEGSDMSFEENQQRQEDDDSESESVSESSGADQSQDGDTDDEDDEETDIEENDVAEHDVEPQDDNDEDDNDPRAPSHQQRGCTGYLVLKLENRVSDNVMGNAQVLYADGSKVHFVPGAQPAKMLHEHRSCD